MTNSRDRSRDGAPQGHPAARTFEFLGLSRCFVSFHAVPCSRSATAQQSCRYCNQVIYVPCSSKSWKVLSAGRLLYNTSSVFSGIELDTGLASACAVLNIAGFKKMRAPKRRSKPKAQDASDCLSD